MILQSCREDIVDPSGLEGNINEPIIFSSSDSFQFILNAEKISYYLIETARFYGTSNKINVKIDNYKGGQVSVYIVNKGGGTNIYGNNFKSGNLEDSKLMIGYIPEKIVLTFDNFSGSLNLNLFAVYDLSFSKKI